MEKYIGQLEVDDWYKQQKDRVIKSKYKPEIAYASEYLGELDTNTIQHLNFLNDSDMLDGIYFVLKGDFYDN